MERRIPKFSIFPYKPHITLAFKDLDEKDFEKAKKYLEDRKFSEITKTDSFSLAENDCFREVVRFGLG